MCASASFFSQPCAGCSHFWWECEMWQPLWKAVWHFLKKLNLIRILNHYVVYLNLIYCYTLSLSQKKLNLHLPHDLDIPFLVFMKKESHVYKNAYMTVVFVFAPNWKRPKCPAMPRKITPQWAWWAAMGQQCGRVWKRLGWVKAAAETESISCASVYKKSPRMKINPSWQKANQ